MPVDDREDGQPQNDKDADIGADKDSETNKPGEEEDTNRNPTGHGSGISPSDRVFKLLIDLYRNGDVRRAEEAQTSSRASLCICFLVCVEIEHVEKGRRMPITQRLKCLARHSPAGALERTGLRVSEDELDVVFEGKEKEDIQEEDEDPGRRERRT
ncbi:hypothetical protein CPC08DRAFT_727633 [Agrocybe pediades]|nr:hypothetical protein CPC08DRAFT_727633 [Agrocybe pediades]